MNKLTFPTLLFTLLISLNPGNGNFNYPKPFMKPERTMVRSASADTISRIPPERAGNTDWFKAAGWGVFVHYLYDVQCAGDHITTMDGVADWDKCVNGFDTEKFAGQISSTGASYVIFTMMQRTRYLIAPNKTYD